MESLITTFHIDWKIIIAQMLNFGVVFLILYLFALKPLKKIMGDREEKIAKGLSDAKANALVIIQTQKEYAEVLNKAKDEAHELFTKGKNEALAKRAEMLAGAEQEVAMMIAKGKQSLEAEKSKIISDAKGEIVRLVIMATEKVLEDTTDSAVKKL
jgi:F-type H+-transporting ATPase subunit b